MNAPKHIFYAPRIESPLEVYNNIVIVGLHMNASASTYCGCDSRRKWQHEEKKHILSLSYTDPFHLAHSILLVCHYNTIVER